MIEDCKYLDTLIIKYKYNKTISNEIEKIKEKWIKEFTKINTDVEWDDLDEAEIKFVKLREKDKLYIKEFILIHYNSGDNKKEEEDDWEKDWEEENNEEENNEEENNEEENNEEENNEEENNEEDDKKVIDENIIKIIIPKKLFGDLPGVKKRGYHKTSKEITPTVSVTEEKAKTEICNLYTIIDDTIKIIRDNHQNMGYIKWLQLNFTTHSQKHKTLNSLSNFMTTQSYSISNKTRNKTILNYKQSMSSKHYTIFKLMFKSKINFSIDLIEELYNQIVYIIHNNLYSYDVDKLIAIFDLLIKNNSIKLIEYISKKTLDIDKYCITI
jgi:hypothetical protein